MTTSHKDSFGRTVDYLRISITDRCNERCLYCLPENYSDWLPRGEILAYDEFLAIVRAATAFGFKRFRVTGGEPLIRPGVVGFVRDLVATPGVESVLLTTNGTRLAELVKPLFEAGLRRVNISLDAIDPGIYRTITNGEVEPVLEGIRLAKEIGFESVKINTVLMRGKNSGEISRLLDFAAKQDVILRFIELMPVSLTEMLNEKNFFPVSELFANLRLEEEPEPLTDSFGFGPAKYFRLKERGVTVGFIGALTDLHFCERCNKMRLTCDGKLRPCLGNHLEMDMKPALRPRIDHARLQAMFAETLLQKPVEHMFRNHYQPHRVMTAIGG